MNQLWEAWENLGGDGKAFVGIFIVCPIVATVCVCALALCGVIKP